MKQLLLTKKLKSSILFPLLIVLFLIAPGQALAGYSLTELQGSSAYIYGDAFDINDAGQIVGHIDLSNTSFFRISQGFLYENGTLTALSVGSLPTGVARAINNHGQIIGSFQAADGNTHVFLRNNGVMEDLGMLNGSGYSGVYDINENGYIVGNASTEDSSIFNIFIYKDGVVTDLGHIGENTFPTAINDSNQIIGQFISPSDRTTHSFLYTGTSLTDLGLFGKTSLYAQDINNHGQVVGTFQDSQGITHGFLYKIGDNNITELGTGPSGALGINDLGQIVGFIYDALGIQKPAIYIGNGEWSELPTPYTYRNNAVEINEAGQIVGTSGGRHVTWKAQSPTVADDCKNYGWKTYVNPSFKNQGDCVSFVQTKK